jgi:hypothetical protein
VFGLDPMQGEPLSGPPKARQLREWANRMACSVPAFTERAFESLAKAIGDEATEEVARLIEGRLVSRKDRRQSRDAWVHHSTSGGEVMTVLGVRP